VAVNDDYEAFAHEIKPASTTISTVDKESKIKNPYIRDNEWHGDAALDMRLAAQDDSNRNDSEVPSSSRIQTKLQSFFQAPVRNLNAVLASGARRMSKIAQVVSARKEATQAAGTTQSRFGGGKKFFPSNNSFRRVSGPTCISWCAGIENQPRKTFLTVLLVFYPHSPHFDRFRLHSPAESALFTKKSQEPILCVMVSCTRIGTTNRQESPPHRTRIDSNCLSCRNLLVFCFLLFLGSHSNLLSAPSPTTIF
jgi:hypothetical protein